MFTLSIINPIIAIFILMKWLFPGNAIKTQQFLPLMLRFHNSPECFYSGPLGAKGIMQKLNNDNNNKAQLQLVKLFKIQF